MHTDEILSILDNVKPAGANQWSAKCPNRDHRNARLYIKDVGDVTLLNCFGGCTGQELTSSMGIKLSDLYRTELTEDDKEERKQRFSHEQLKHERLIVQIASNSTRPLSMDDKERVKLAKLRLREGGWLTMSDKLIEQDRRRLGWLS